MIKKNKTLEQSKKRQSQRGQIAIFMLLIFQILFVLFAMTLNIALTVHDKINLQNSVDLAALYGAKKQAEVLNAMAHINYQMRQNYKLLAWRYRILGSVAQENGVAANGVAWCPRPDGGTYAGYLCTRPHPHTTCAGNAYPPGYCDSNFTVCMSVDLWKRGIKPGEQNLCENQREKIERIQDVQIIFPAPWNFHAQRRQVQLRDNLEQDCPTESLINWLMTQLFLSQFRLDQKDRKLMIYAIYNATFKNPGDPKDLDGNSIKEGVEKTLLKNLTYTNRENFNSSHTEFETFSSPKENQALETLLKPVHIFPILEYLHFEGGGGSNGACSNTQPKFSIHPKPNVSSPNSVSNKLNDFISDWSGSLFIFNRGHSPTQRYLGQLTVGYEKKQDLTVYYGVSVKLPHKSFHQLFSPFQGSNPSNTLELKASAFAKPFGGRIGWPIGPPGARDKILEYQTLDRIRNTGANPWGLKPNYSHFPGDQWGLIRKEAHQRYYLIKKEKWVGAPINNPFNIVNYMNLTNRDPLADNNLGTTNGATIADSGQRNFSLKMMELLAVAPDVFDILNYSIFNNYMDTYFPKICRLISTSGQDCNPDQAVPIKNSLTPGYTLPSPLNGQIRGDFGYPHSYIDWNQRDVKNPSPLIPFFFFPTDTIKHRATSPPLGGTHASIHTPPWIIKDPAHLLTGFVPTAHPDRYNDFNAAGPEIFMRCYKPTRKDQQTDHIPYGCAEGGRSGYSVKLVSCDIINSLSSPTQKPTSLNQSYCQP